MEQRRPVEAGAKFSASHLRFALGQAEARAGIAHLGGGGEGFFTRNLGVGADLGYLTPMRRFSDRIGTISPNLVARYGAQDITSNLEPFVTGGYTLLFRWGKANGFNFGDAVVGNLTTFELPNTFGEWEDVCHLNAFEAYCPSDWNFFGNAGASLRVFPKEDFPLYFGVDYTRYAVLKNQLVGTIRFTF